MHIKPTGATLSPNAIAAAGKFNLTVAALAAGSTPRMLENTWVSDAPDGLGSAALPHFILPPSERIR